MHGAKLGKRRQVGKAETNVAADLRRRNSNAKRNPRLHFGGYPRKAAPVAGNYGLTLAAKRVKLTEISIEKVQRLGGGRWLERRLARCHRVKRKQIMSKLDRLSEFGGVNPGLAALDANRNWREEHYRIWAVDNQVYGPVPWRVLQQWAGEGRVQRKTWIFLEGAQEWRVANQIEALHNLFPPGETTIFLQRQATEPDGVTPEELRQFPSLATLSNSDLAQLIRLGDLRHAHPDDVIIKRGDPGDALFFILAGKVRARIFVGLEKKDLAEMNAGEIFGDMAMFTQSARSADVVAETEARLLRVSADSFRLLITQSPSAAASMLFGIAGTMAHRILDDDLRLFQREVPPGLM